MKPEIVAPGSMIISSVNSCDRNHGRYGADYDFVVAKEPQSNHYYAVMQGTSMAAPVVTGAVALLLQECPTLTPDSVRSILQRTANLDNTLAAYAPKVRGAGMLNALKAAQAVQGRACQAVVEVPFACKPTSAPKNSFWQNADELSFSIVPNPNSGAFTVQTEEQSELTLSVYNLWGVLVHRQTLPAGGEAQLQHLPQGVYVVQLSSSSMQGAQKMLIYR
jgi:hypothetical protein